MPKPVSRSHRRTLVSVAVVAAAFATVSCKGTDSGKVAPDGPPGVGGTMVIATAADATSLLPSIVNVITDRQVTDLLFDRLADLGDEMNAVGDKGFKPQLAERWEWAADSLSIAFHINPKAKWHDGVPVRASDVRYSLNLLKDPGLGSSAAPLVGNIDSVNVRDSLTAVAYFKRHTPEQFYDLVYQVAIVPEHILGNTPAAKLRDSEVTRRGIGSGRFRLSKWEPGARIELIADTANYRGRAKLDRVVFAISPDFNGAVTRFFAGDADMFENLRPEHLAKLLGDTARRAVPYPSLGYMFMAFNNLDPKDISRPHPIFGERAVRRALSMAVDRKAMLKNVFDTLGIPLYGPFPRSLNVSDTTLPQLPYDTVKAKALLDSAGWLVGPDGIRAKAGRRLAFSIATPSSSAARKQYAVLLQDAMHRVGADVKLDESDFASFVAKFASRSYDVAMDNYNTDPSVSGFKQSWSTSGIGKDGSNHAGYSNPVVDAMLDSAILTFDPARTKAYARRAFETIIEDAPAIWLYEPPTRAGIARRIRTTHMRADGWWSGLADWWIPANERSQRDQIGLRPAP
ncbi:MAG: peptide ABC transporter substrate-binding protein [Gemmatimonadaceae bacterium]